MHVFMFSYGLDQGAEPSLIAPNLLTSVVDMWHACHELGCSVENRLTHRRSEREVVEGNMDQFVHVRPQQDVFVLNVNFHHEAE